MQYQAVVKHGADPLRKFGYNAWQEDCLDIIVDGGEHLAVGLVLRCLRRVARGDKIIVLGADNDCVDAHRMIMLVIFHCHLTLGVGTQICHFLMLAADGAQLAEDRMGEVEGQRHVVLGLVAGIAKHHSLVAGALLVRILALYASVDVGALLMDGVEHTT